MSRARRAAAGRPRPADLRPAGLRHRPLQLPLPVLHAGRGPALAGPQRDPHASRRSSGSSALLAAMGVRDVRLTGGEPLVRRELPEAGRDARPRSTGLARPVADDQRLPARGDGRRAGRRRAAAHQRLARLALARPLLPDHPPRLAAAGDAGLEALERHPAAQPGQGQLRGDARLHRGGGDPVRRAGAAQALPGALHRVHAARRRPRLVGGPRPDRRRDARDDRRASTRSSRCRASRTPPRASTASATARARSASSTPSPSRSAATATASA